MAENTTTTVPLAWREGWAAWSTHADCPYPPGADKDEWKKGWWAHAYLKNNKQVQEFLYG